LKYEEKRNWYRLRQGPVSTEKGFVNRYSGQKKEKRDGRGLPGRPPQESLTLGSTGEMLIGGKAKPSRQ